MQARQRLSAVVEEELGRIGRLRGRLQQIAEADQAEAPVRLAFETGTEGDRQRRYALSYERLVNRRIDTFLKVRKASGSGELDFAELAGVMDAEELAELVAAGGMATFQNTEDLRSGDGRGPETRPNIPTTAAVRRARNRETCGRATCEVWRPAPNIGATGRLWRSAPNTGRKSLIMGPPRRPLVR